MDDQNEWMLKKTTTDIIFDIMREKKPKQALP
jgi:hypothetical protein